MTVKAYFDGACQPRNPGGHMAWGWIVTDDTGSVTIDSGSGYAPGHPKNSNNVAEYTGALECLRGILRLNPAPASATIHGDSKLVIEQITGRWRVRKGLYIDVYRELRGLVDTCPIGLTWQWIRRERNTRADHLAAMELRKRSVAIVLGKAAQAEPDPPVAAGDQAERLVRDAMHAVTDAHATWQADDAFVKWVMRDTGYTRDEVLGLRCGMLDSYSAWRGGVECGMWTGASVLRTVSGQGGDPVSEALLDQAQVIESQAAHLARETETAMARITGGMSEWWHTGWRRRHRPTTKGDET